ncbi:hypothetical protein [Bifidobacterium psychraerophilum]|uniref:hypothetical protein n=1 Tax=Bifidobacterium psychraerophilum TaxID=218140 RepID=UPI0039E7E540
MVTALGVDVDTDGNGVDPLTHRNIIKRHWVNTGVVGGLAVSGRSDLYYAVSAGMAVCSMGDADGYVEAYWPGGVTENAVSAGDGTYSRIDSVYLLANTGTPDNLVHCAVAQGTPAASPVAPTLPTGSLRVQDMLVPAGASATSSASRNGSRNYAIAYGSGLGRIGYAENTTTTEQAYNTNWYTQVAATVLVPTDRLVDVRWTARASGSGGSTESSYYIQLLIDGAVVSDGQDEISVPANYERKQFSYSPNLTPGEHTIVIQAKCNTGRPKFTWRGIRTIEVFDRGVAQ